MVVIYNLFVHLFHKIHPSACLVAFCVGIILGDIVALVFQIQFFGSFLWLILAIFLLLLALMTSRRISILPAVLAGVFLISFRVAPGFSSKEIAQSLVGQEITVTGRIIKDPSESSSGKYNIILGDLVFSFVVSENSLGSSKDSSELDSNSSVFNENSSESSKNSLELTGTLFTQLSASDFQKYSVQRSDTLTISGEFSESFGTYVGAVFRPNIQEITRPEPGDVFLRIRDFFADKVRDYIPSPENGLALGYLLGQKSGVDQNFQSALRVVGLTHIVVASGAHLGTLTSFARKIFGRFSRFAGTLAGGLMTIFFIGITGLSASMIRAGLVTGISLFVSYFGRKVQPARLIILVAAMTLIYSPEYLTDLAWLLSFASFSGILIVSPALIKFFYGNSKKPNFVFSTLISSFAAALLCTPILLYYFGQMSLISIIANLLVLPTVSIAMGLTFATGVFAMFLPPLANVFGKITTLLLDYQISVVNFFSEKTIFLITVDPENPLVFLLYIPLVIVIIFLACYSRYKLRRSRENSAKISNDFARKVSK